MNKQEHEKIQELHDKMEEIGVILERQMKLIADLPLKKHCPICNRYMLGYESIIFADGIWKYGWDDLFKNRQYFSICPVCANSLENNEPLRQKVWADLTRKKAK